MYISLSSKGSTNHARFSNHLLDNLIIKPFSEICLVNASINQNPINQIITVEANTTLYLRADPFNTIKILLTTEKRTFTPQQLVDKGNAGLLDNEPYGVRAEFILTETNEIQIRFYVPDDYDGYKNFLNYVWGSPTIPCYNANYPALNWTATNSIANGVTGLYTPIQFDSTDISVALPPYVSADLSEYGLNINPYPANSDISHEFNRAKCLYNGYNFENTIYDKFSVVTCPYTETATNLTDNRFHITWGASTLRGGGGGSYTKIPGSNFGGDNAPFQEELQLRGDNSLELTVYDEQAQVRQPFAGTYLSGDVFQHYLQPVTIADPTQLNPEKLFVPIWRQQDFKGLVYWAPLSLSSSSGLLYNTLRIEHEPDTGFLTEQIFNSNTQQNFLNAMGYETADETAKNKVLGVYSGYGQYDGGAYTDYNSITPLFVAEKNNVVDKSTGQASNYFNNFPIFFRRDPADGAGAVQTLKGRLQLNDYHIDNRGSCVIQVYVSPLSDSGYNNDLTIDTMTVIGGVRSDLTTEQAVFQIALAQAETWDFRIRDETGRIIEGILEDGLGTRISIASGSKYMFIISYTKGDNLIKITCAEVAITFDEITAYTFEQTVDPDTEFLNVSNINYLGGVKNTGGLLNVAQNYYCGQIGQFRLYHFPNAYTNANLPSDDTGDPFYDILLGPATGNFRTDIACAAPQFRVLFGDQPGQRDEKFAVCGNGVRGVDLDNRTNYCPAYFNTLSATPAILKNQYYPDLVDVFSPPNIILPIGNANPKKNYVDTNALGNGAYTGFGSGIVETQLYPFLDIDGVDGVNNRDVFPYLTEPTGDGRPYGIVGAEVEPTIIKDEGLRICIDNLPQRTYNGTTGNISKCIFQSVHPEEDVDDLTTKIQVEPKSKVWHSLDNAGELAVNEFDVTIRDVDEIVETNIIDFTTVNIEIRQERR
tara:strand:+ start:1257 stop:4055 length:2799 start_codon:yes stop_codon:yes gene_type:complete